MSELLSVSALGLMLSLFLGLLRVVRGPDAGDRMLATQLIGTAGVGVISAKATMQYPRNAVSSTLQSR